VGTSWVTLVTLAALSGTARAQCKPAAIADGDPQLVTDLISKLSANGIATARESGCPSVQVRIEQRGALVHVRLADAFQRTSERDVQDVATAAAVIESWTYQEIDAGTLPAEPAPVVIAEAPHVARTGIAVSAMSALGSNGGTTWIGGSISGCFRVGPLCTGVALRTQLDTDATGDSSPLSQDSYVLSAIATIDLPRHLGGFVLSPGIGVGYGYLHVVTHHHDAMNNPLDVPTADHQLRAAAHAALMRPLGDHVSAFADLWTDATLLRSDSQFGPGVSLVLALGLRLEAR
jgi:hypothetical protein